MSMRAVAGIKTQATLGAQNARRMQIKRKVEAPSPPGFELLSTRRLHMRGLVNSDASDLLELDRDVRVTRFLLDDEITNMTQALVLIAYINHVYRNHPGLGIWHTRNRRQQFIGYFSLMPLEDSDDVEIGVKLMPSAWGRNYAIEGGRGLCDYAFGSVGLRRLIALCHPENRVIPLLLDKLGFVADGHTTHFGKPALRFALTVEDYAASPLR